MCGIVGWVNTEKNLTNETKVIEHMTNTLDKRGPDAHGICVYENAVLGHRRLVVVDPEGGTQPMTRYIGDNKYTIVYNGELYNTEEVRKKLLVKGYTFKAYSDTEVLLVAYMEWGEDCLNHINGIFAFGVWDEKNKSLFLARDPLGVKPLFYVHKGNSLIFASEIKALLKHPLVEPIVDREGLMEIFGLGPARSLGSGIFKNIKEVPPAHCLNYKLNKINMREYWKLEAKKHTDNLNDTIDNTRNLLVDAIERQLVSDVPVCTFLSGGLDSSAISAIASNYYKRNGQGVLNTFSIDYEDNDKYFKANEFQPNSDSIWIKKMVDFIESNHTNVVIDNNQLAYALKDAVIANDLPGMADIDSSLYLFCSEVRKKATVSVSGECADEIFGGYPWFTNQNLVDSNTFPWAGSVNERKSILGKEFKNLPIEEYIAQKYIDTINRVPKLNGESKEDSRMRELFYLNIKWFMLTLLNRKDRMSMSNSLEVRVPFADYRIVEYCFNIPKDMKLLDGREKGLLRKALVGILPDEIIYRKKSPYPKTHNPKYTKLVKSWMMDIISYKNSPILQIIDKNTVMQMISSDKDVFEKPWYGQLMTGPQVIAYLIQIDTWMKEYNVRIES